MQKLWKDRYEWDEILPEDVSKTWTDIRNDIQEVTNNTPLSRYYFEKGERDNPDVTCVCGCQSTSIRCISLHQQRTVNNVSYCEESCCSSLTNNSTKIRVNGRNNWYTYSNTAATESRHKASYYVE